MGFDKTVRGPKLKIVNGTSSSNSNTYSWTRRDVSSSVKRKKPLGTNLIVSPTVYAREHTFQTYGLATYQTSDGTFQSAPAVTAPTPPVLPNDDYQAAYAAAVTKLRLKIKGEEWNLSTFIGELPETMRYFSKTLQSVVSAYRAVKRGDMKRLRRIRDSIREDRRPGSRSLEGPERAHRRWQDASHNASDEVSRRWMEWRYAIMPLTYDLDDMLKALYSKRSNFYYRKSVTGVRIPFSKSEVAWEVEGQHVMWNTSIHAMLRLGAFYAVNPRVEEWKRLGLLNPMATLYELTPLSFVLDWLIPVGDYIASLDALAGVTVSTTWSSLREEGMTQQVGVQTLFTYGPENAYWRRQTVASCFASRNAYSRNIGVSLDPVLPSFGLSLTAKRLLDSLALTKLLFFRKG